jgi:hypothetical protein
MLLVMVMPGGHRIRVGKKESERVLANTVVLSSG